MRCSAALKRDYWQHLMRSDRRLPVQVYDFTCFFDENPCYEHPGGNDIILEWAGRDGTQGFVDAGATTLFFFKSKPLVMHFSR